MIRGVMTWSMVAGMCVLSGCPKKPTGPVSTTIPGLGGKDYTRPLPPGARSVAAV